MRALAIATLLMVAIACAGTSAPPQTSYYLLPVEGPAGVTRLDAPVKVGLSRIQVADYLSQDGLIVETTDGTIRPARFHEWAEPLSDGLRRVLFEQISTALGYAISTDTARRSDWELVLDVEIDRLHGTLSGDAILVARWRLTPREAPERSVAYRFSQTQPLQHEGYPALVETETMLLQELSDAIAGSIRELQP